MIVFPEAKGEVSEIFLFMKVAVHDFSRDLRASKTKKCQIFGRFSLKNAFC